MITWRQWLDLRALTSFIISLSSLPTLLWPWSISKSFFVAFDYSLITISIITYLDIVFFLLQLFDYSRIRITWRHWLDPRALITLLMSVFSLQSDKFNFCREDSSSWKGKESVYNQYSYKRRVRYCICHWKPVSGWLWPPSHGRLLLPWSSAGSYWCSGWGREMAWKRVLNHPHIYCHHNKPGFM